MWHALLCGLPRRLVRAPSWFGPPRNDKRGGTGTSLPIPEKPYYSGGMDVRKIIHVDMDAFYASVEQRDNPSLRGKPVIVGGSPDDRGVVASASYEARKWGVRSAMSSRRAAGLCPSAVFVRPHMERYKEVSRSLRSLFHAVTDRVEPLSLDEAYLDVTENKLGEPSATNLAKLLRRQIQTDLELTASAGVGPNKFVAKVASDIKKPNGLTVIPPSRVREFISALPVERFWGVGPATATKLHAKGIKTGADLRRQSPATLYGWLGNFGLFLHDLSEGRDDRPVSADREAKSRGSETTFTRDILDVALLEKTIQELAEDVAQSLERLDRRGRSVVLKVKYADFSTITRTRTLETDSREAATIAQTATLLLRNATEAGHTPIRLLGVSVKLPCAEPFKADSAQLNLEM
jgi:DNA polymerase IV